MYELAHKHRRGLAVLALLAMIFTYLAAILPAQSQQPGAAAQAGTFSWYFEFVNGETWTGTGSSPDAQLATDGTLSNPALFATITDFEDRFSHVSCSEVYTDGWHDGTGDEFPQESKDDAGWRIAYYEITTGAAQQDTCSETFVEIVDVSVSGQCDWADGVTTFTYTVTADEGVTVDFDGGDQDLTNGETYQSSSSSADWTATAPEGSVFSNMETTTSGTENVDDCTPGTVSVDVSGECTWADGVTTFTYTVTADEGVTVDVDGDDTNYVNGDTFESDNSVDWVATAPEGSVFSNNETTTSGTETVEDCTPEPPSPTSVVLSTCRVVGDSSETLITGEGDPGTFFVVEGPDGFSETYVVDESGTVSDWLAPGEYTWTSFTAEEEPIDEGAFTVEDCTPPPLGSLGDYVWFDADEDGQQGDPAEEVGVAGATVNLWQDGVMIATTTTDADGRYLFSDLEAGQYQVEFVLPTGFVGFTTPNSGDDATDSDADPTTGLSHVVDLPVGGEDLTIDAGVVVEVEAQVEEPETLPETGMDNGPLALLGAAFLGLGALLLSATSGRREEEATN